MSRPFVPRPGRGGPRLPQSVLRRRPAEVVFEPPPSLTAVEEPLELPAGGVLATATSTIPQPRARRLPAPPPAIPRQRTRAAPPPRPVPPPRPLRGRRPVPVALMAAALVFAGLFAVGLGLGAATGFDLGDFFRGPDEPPPRAFPVLEPSRPVSLTIPAIKVSAPIMQVGLANDGSVDVPPLQRHNEAGWFDEGPTPGQFGPAIIVGHADTRTGPSVFHNLKKLKPGQKVEVKRKDDSIAIFEINSVEHFGKTKLPVKRVYADYTRPVLRLMTCGGTWLGGTRGYEDNYVVFASLVSSKDP